MKPALKERQDIFLVLKNDFAVTDFLKIFRINPAVATNSEITIIFSVILKKHFIALLFFLRNIIVDV